MRSKFIGQIQVLSARFTRSQFLTDAVICLILPSTILAYWAAGMFGFFVTAMAMPILAIFLRRLKRSKTSAATQQALQLGGQTLFEFNKFGQDRLFRVARSGKETACFILSIDHFNALQDTYGADAMFALQQTFLSRLTEDLRDGDVAHKSRSGEFTILIRPQTLLNLDICVQMARRLQTAIKDPFTLGATTVELTATIGFCRSGQLTNPSFFDLESAAKRALIEAKRQGKSAIRSFCDSIVTEDQSRKKLISDAAKALQNKEIVAWFQPQICAKTLEISGFEALARWDHPERGTMPPSAFLDTLAESGQLQDLSEHMLATVIAAIQECDAKGFHLPKIGVNLSAEELRDPVLSEKIQWALDRQKIAPSRLSIEILESVIAGRAHGVVSRNVNALSSIGCQIDLDDFGTGHASISSIRRFAVSRLKIDRSFVTNVDRDYNQQRLIAAIVSMAHELGLQTLAEGIETLGEHQKVTELGCDFIQGYRIAKPMPLDEAIPWMIAYNARLHPSPEITRHTG